jgi:hypothetical protein
MVQNLEFPENGFAVFNKQDSEFKEKAQVKY